MTESRIRTRTEQLMAQFDVKRHHHRFCVDTVHYVAIACFCVEVLDSADNLPYGSEVIFSTVKIHGSYVSESQRATLRERIRSYLRGAK